LRELRVMECGLGTSLEVPKPLAGLTFKVSMHGTFVHAEGNSGNKLYTAAFLFHTSQLKQRA